MIKKAEFNKDGDLVITMAAEQSNPQPSKSGNSRIIASSGGNKPTALTVQGCNVVIGVNAYIPR